MFVVKYYAPLLDTHGTAFHCTYTARCKIRRACFPWVFAFSSVVGYQNKALNEKFNFVVNTFVPVGTDKEAMTFGDIKPNENFINSSIQLLTDGGATAKVTV